MAKKFTKKDLSDARKAGFGKKLPKMPAQSYRNSNDELIRRSDESYLNMLKAYEERMDNFAAEVHDRAKKYRMRDKLKAQIATKKEQLKKTYNAAA